MAGDYNARKRFEEPRTFSHNAGSHMFAETSRAYKEKGKTIKRRGGGTRAYTKVCVRRCRSPQSIGRRDTIVPEASKGKKRGQKPRGRGVNGPTYKQDDRKNNSRTKHFPPKVGAIRKAALPGGEETVGVKTYWRIRSNASSSESRSFSLERLLAARPFESGRRSHGGTRQAKKGSPLGLHPHSGYISKVTRQLLRRDSN